MGGHPSFYFVPYQENLHQALRELREHESPARPYQPVMPFSGVSAAAKSPVQPTRAPERAILSLWEVDEAPAESRVAVPLEAEVLEELYGTTQPTREMLVKNPEFLEDLEPGQGVYVIVYQDGQPAEILFAEYCAD